MSNSLSIALIIFAIIWFIILIIAVRKEKISIKYSLIWFIAALMMLFVGAFPGVMNWVNSIFHFALVSNLVIGILITLLMVITFVLTLYTTKQQKQIDSLIQDVSILKNEKQGKDKAK